MNKSKTRWKRYLRRMLELLIEVIFAILLVCLVLYYAGHSAPGHRNYWRWISLGVASAITFGYPIKWYRRFWDKNLFWLALTILMAAHVLVFAALILSVEQLPLIVYPIITPFEWMLITPILEKAGNGIWPKWVS
ncbi:MAG: hypothetical protein U0V70_07480 [Terriglobia bacterium]